MRKGMMVGKGKKGYHNVIGKDPIVHSMSAKGIKQPQRARYIGKVQTDKVPNIKLSQIGGDVNWEEYSGQFIVDEKFNNGDFDYYLIIDFTNLKEAMGDEAENKYSVSINAVAPSQVSKDKIKSAFDSTGIEEKEEINRLTKDKKALSGILSEYGIHASLYNQDGNNAKELMNEAKKQIPAINTLFGFYMDKPVNMMGNSGWDSIKGDIGFKR